MVVISPALMFSIFLLPERIILPVEDSLDVKSLPDRSINLRPELVAKAHIVSLIAGLSLL